MLYSETKRRALTLIGVPSAKVKMINVRLAPAVHDAFKIACELRGASMSSLLHQFIVRTIREEKEADPRAFRMDNVQEVGHDIVFSKIQGELTDETTPIKKRRRA